MPQPCPGCPHTRPQLILGRGPRGSYHEVDGATAQLQCSDCGEKTGLTPSHEFPFSSLTSPDGATWAEGHSKNNIPPLQNGSGFCPNQFRQAIRWNLGRNPINIWWQKTTCFGEKRFFLILISSHYALEKFCWRLPRETEKLEDMCHHAFSTLSKAGEAGARGHSPGSPHAADSWALGDSRLWQDSPSVAQA